MATVYRYRGAKPGKQQGTAPRPVVAKPAQPEPTSQSESKQNQKAKKNKSGERVRESRAGDIGTAKEVQSRKHREPVERRESSVHPSYPSSFRTEELDRIRHEGSQSGRDEVRKAKEKRSFEGPPEDGREKSKFSYVDEHVEMDKRVSEDVEHGHHSFKKSRSRFDRSGDNAPHGSQSSSLNPPDDDGYETGNGPSSSTQSSSSTSEAVLAALSKARDLAARPVSGSKSIKATSGSASGPEIASSVTDFDYMSAGWVAKESTDQPKRRRGAISKQGPAVPSSSSSSQAAASPSLSASAPSEEALLSNDGNFLELAKQKIAMGPPVAATKTASAAETATPVSSDVTYSGFYNGLSGYATETYIQQQQQQQFYLQQQQQQAYLMQQQQEQYYAAQAAQADPAAYYAAFWEYFAAYGEDLARQYYGDASPPLGTAPPPGVVDPTKNPKPEGSDVNDSDSATADAVDAAEKPSVSGSSDELLAQDTTNPPGGDGKTIEDLKDSCQVIEGESDQSAHSTVPDGEENAAPVTGNAQAENTTPSAPGLDANSAQDEESVRKQWTDYYASHQQHAAYAAGIGSGVYNTDPSAAPNYTDAFSSQYEAYFNHYKQAFSTQADSSSSEAQATAAPESAAEAEAESGSPSLASELAAAYYSATTTGV